jgi:hypothetical protein
MPTIDEKKKKDIEACAGALTLWGVPKKLGVKLLTEKYERSLMSVDVSPFKEQIAGPMEMQEYLFAVTQSNKIKGNWQSFNGSECSKDIREILRLHRFTVLNWLMMQGVSIPMNLLSDQTHPKVGSMLPDMPIPERKK